ncbi:nuclear transport factor 2 family protein [Hahella ganghwensis]|uniref:nuclear transport factor 2 family protein n=1 Tax=Hahella ganghwensis TaxID=286420 RepID=UPI00036A95EA|nr:nuclear transport factor 2 family protein [Hahella ganghwensis]
MQRLSSSATNLDLIKGFFEAFSRKDLGTIESLLAPDIHYRFPSSSHIPFAGSWQGKDKFMEFLQVVDEHLDIDEFSPETYLPSENHVVVLGQEKALVKKTNKPFTSQWALVFHITNEKITELWDYSDSLAVAEAFESK